jgi:hypothetical protein
MLLSGISILTTCFNIGLVLPEAGYDTALKEMKKKTRSLPLARVRKLTAGKRVSSFFFIFAS